MKNLTVNEAAKLIKAKSVPAISLYLATDVSDKDVPGKLKVNLQRLYKTAEKLVLKTYDLRTAQRLLQPLKKALSMLGLNKAKGGVGIYHSAHFTGIVRLPTVTSDLVVAADSFHLKPVLRCMQSRRDFYVLALKKKYSDLLLVTADGMKLVERVAFKLPQERQPASERGSKHWLMDGIRLRRQKDLKVSMDNLNRQLEIHWQGGKSPLLLAGSHFQQEAFRKVCTYPHILERGIDGYIDDLNTESLATLSQTRMQHYFAELDERSVDAFRRAESSLLTTTNLAEIAKAAAHGQIQSLLIAEDRHIWGHLDRDTGDMHLLTERGEIAADDILDDLAEETLNKGGAVTVLPISRMPKHQPVAAILRWSNTPVALPATHIAMQMSWRKHGYVSDEISA